MSKISTGEENNLKTWRKIAVIISGGDETMEAVKFIDKKIAESPNGELERVIADERQVLYLLVQLNYGGLKNGKL